jgi:hypothetical protein
VGEVLEFTYRELKAGVDLDFQHLRDRKRELYRGTHYAGIHPPGIYFKTPSSHFDKNRTTYTQTVVFLDFVEAMRSSGMSLRDKVRLMLEGDLAINCNCPCLVGDTKIPLLDGRTLTIEELAKEFESSDTAIYVYSADASGDFVPGKATFVGKTGETRSLVRVTLDNDEVITCTPEHPFMLRDGTYKEAKFLSSGDSLMPLYQGADCKVTSVVFVELDAPVPVYDITVEDYHNFAVGQGIYVHNSHHYNGYHFILTNLSAEADGDENRFPRIRNPRLRGTVCKHGALVLDALPFVVMNVARDLKNAGYE